MGLDPAQSAKLQQQLDLLVAQQRELVARLERGQSHFMQLARSVWRVQEEERRRLARELHDGIGQNLTAIVRMLDQALDAPARDGAARSALERARALTASTLAEARALSRQLRPQILDDLGLVAALRWLARSFADNHALDVQLDLGTTLPPLSAEAETLIFRVAQEGLNNTARHAGATSAMIQLRTVGPLALLELRDDGRGCDPQTALIAGAEGRGSGLGGMRDRVRLFGGDLRIASKPGAGFTIQIEFPLSKNEKKTNPGSQAP